MMDMNKLTEEFFKIEKRNAESDVITPMVRNLLSIDNHGEDVLEKLMPKLMDDERWNDVVLGSYNNSLTRALLYKMIKEKLQEMGIKPNLSSLALDERVSFNARISLIKRFEDVFNKVRKPNLPDYLEALQEMTVLMIDTYEHLQLENNNVISKNDPEFLKEVEQSMAEVNGYLKAHREDVLDRGIN